VLQQHVDHKITNALLKKGTRDAYKTWNKQDRAWWTCACTSYTTRAELV
jgi:hypothetical protein